MTEFVGTTGDDTFVGDQFDQNDFDMSQGGNDTVTGGIEDDQFYFGAAFTAADSINGEGGSGDTLDLDGDYSAGVVFGAQTLVNVANIRLDDNHSYKLTTNDATVAANSILFVDAQGNHTTLVFNGAAETDGRFAIIAGAGNDTITGGAQNDSIDLTDGGNDNVQGGNDTVNGGAGDDTINDSGALNASDNLNGGGGNDTLVLTYREPPFSKIVLGPHTVVNIEKILIDNMSLTTNDATVASGKTLTIDGQTNDKGDGGITIDGSAETNGHFHFMGSSQNDVFIGGAQSDTFDLAWRLPSTGLVSSSGNDTAEGGGGNDFFDFVNVLGAFTNHDKIDGGAGTDTVQLEADFTGTHKLVFSPSTMVNVEILKLMGGDSPEGPYSYNLTTADTTVATGQTLTVDASNLASASHLTFNGAAETDGHFFFKSGAGTDTLTGGALSDTFSYRGLSGISGATRDIIHAFDFSNDIVNFKAITGIDAAVTTGTASSATIDTNLTNIFGSGQAHQLGAHHAVLFTASNGTLHGQTFLIVDGDGHAGYSVGHDLVIQITGALNVADMSAANFIG